MNINHSLFKTMFYLTTLGGILVYLYITDLLKWVIVGLSTLYLIFYFSIATIAVFTVSLSEIGPLLTSMSQKSPLMAIALLVPTVFLLWCVLLLFWPLFIIPDSSFASRDKYDAIDAFEEKVKAKYF